ncbi:peptide-methionine (S)-S-oxide reductase [Jejuia pallidilutea]|uniref:peptide-methionine (S)-S-oxide reductase n=1 Tax=Jejuia pallidilutea TaxID=504487 RepID=A0A090VS00_9FLAO|nr:peptide-methionine (S)-S-oxide reductase [Jejuia pallidilutea]GAL66803.1 peptide methionine sulfoxide reductase MsrA [Jejuia pallidilutea]GAL70409.1 peptide methionine sulfoxide reductase MsrA [Jejuia pallidilutea]GAL90483.1 peptide methionine sulfoxide reductase MsrA [Jejuia pallidilutea]
MEALQKIAFGGGCHWCTEAVFQSLIGVFKVEQGFVGSIDADSSFSEAVIVHFNSAKIALSTLIEIHLHTHKSTSNHSMRTKYRSAIYTFSEEQMHIVTSQLELLQFQFQNKIITKVLPFNRFKASRVQIQNYYYSNPKKPFCESFINPKLKLLLHTFSKYTDQSKLKRLNNESGKTKYSE